VHIRIGEPADLDRTSPGADAINGDIIDISIEDCSGIQAIETFYGRVTIDWRQGSIGFAPIPCARTLVCRYQFPDHWQSADRA